MLKSFVKSRRGGAAADAPRRRSRRSPTVDPNQPDSWQAEAGAAKAEAEKPPTLRPTDYAPIEDRARRRAPGRRESTPRPRPRRPQQSATRAARGRVHRRRGRCSAAAPAASPASSRTSCATRASRSPISPARKRAAPSCFGVRYGSGTMHHQIEGDRAVYWTGPSIGFDVGGDVNKVFVLVYNLHDSQRLFRRYPGGEGRAYFVGGFSAHLSARRRRGADPGPPRRRAQARRQCRLYALLRAQPLAAVLTGAGHSSPGAGRGLNETG